MSPMMTLNTDNGYILVVHSDPVMRDWLAENLSACGHTVAICDNAEEAWLFLGVIDTSLLLLTWN